MSDLPKDIETLNKRIENLKAKQKKTEKSSIEATGIHMAFQVAVELVSGPIVGAGIGYILDELFDTKPILLVIFTIFGGAAGLLNVARFIDKTDEEGNKG